MKTLLAVLITLALAIPASAQWTQPVGECEYPNGSVVTDPGTMPLACGPVDRCVLFDADLECLDYEEYQPAGCAFTGEQATSDEYRTAWRDWYSAKYLFNYCVLIDYIMFIYANIPH